MSTKHGPKGKGTGSKGKAAGKGQRIAKAVPAPEAVVEDVAGEAGEMVTPFDDPATDAGASEDAPVEDASATVEPTPKRKRDMTIAELQAAYEATYGHATDSTDRRYLLWRLSPAGQRRNVTNGPRRAARPKEAMQVLPLGMARDTVAKLDAAVKALGFKSRMAFIRDAMVAKLGFEGSQHGADPAIAEAADAIRAESAPAA